MIKSETRPASLRVGQEVVNNSLNLTCHRSPTIVTARRRLAYRKGYRQVSLIPVPFAKRRRRGSFVPVRRAPPPLNLIPKAPHSDLRSYFPRYPDS